MSCLRASLWGLLFVCILSGCGSLEAPVREAPAYTRTAEHYRTFADADALATYLRASTETTPLISAHRGSPRPAYPENAIATFEQALRYAPALIECDVRMTRDSVLVLLHDDTLDRTTTGQGAIADRAFEALRPLLLKDENDVITPFRIPTLDEVLAWAQGRAVLTLDVKSDVPPTAIVQAVQRLNAENRVVLIAYTLDAVLRYHQLAPDIMISASVATTAEVQALLNSGIDTTRLIAFTGVGEVKPEVIDLLHTHNIRAILGTFGLIDDRAREGGVAVYQALIERGIDVIATDNVPLASKAIEAYH